jgi:hypothetical protein
MTDHCTRDLYVTITEDRATIGELVGVHQRYERGLALIAHADTDVVGVHFEEQSGDLLEGRRSPRIYLRVQPDRPRRHDEISVVGVVI